MGWPFCDVCGSILDPPGPTEDEIKCSFCHFHCKFQDVLIEEVLTRSAPLQKPAWIGEDTADKSSGDKEPRNKHAMIEEPCPKCGNPELFFYTMQLRSVDEGSTVFYECPKCSHKYAQNN